MKNPQNGYDIIADKISGSKRGFRKRFAVIGGGIIGTGILAVVFEQKFPEIARKIGPMMKVGRYIFAFGVVGAMVGLSKKKK